MTSQRYWNVTRGNSHARVRAEDIEGARARAAQIGFGNPDSIVLAYDLAIPQAPEQAIASWRAKIIARNFTHERDWDKLTEAERIFWRQQYIQRMKATT